MDGVLDGVDSVSYNAPSAGVNDWPVIEPVVADEPDIVIAKVFEASTPFSRKLEVYDLPEPEAELSFT
jgi:hypothetical protein